MDWSGISFIVRQSPNTTRCTVPFRSARIQTRDLFELKAYRALHGFSPRRTTLLFLIIVPYSNLGFDASDHTAISERRSWNRLSQDIFSLSDSEEYAKAFSTR